MFLNRDFKVTGVQNPALGEFVRKSYLLQEIRRVSIESLCLANQPSEEIYIIVETYREQQCIQGRLPSSPLEHIALESSCSKRDCCSKGMSRQFSITTGCDQFDGVFTYQRVLEDSLTYRHERVLFLSFEQCLSFRSSLNHVGDFEHTRDSEFYSSKSIMLDMPFGILERIQCWRTVAICRKVYGFRRSMKSCE